MIYLLLSIIFSTGIFVIFKYFGIYKIDVLKAIFINYIVAFILGFTLSESSFSLLDVPKQPWFYGALFLGALFISIFFVMAITSQKNGVSVASVAGKMSVVIPVLFGLFLYNETISFFKIIGIAIAVFAVYLASVKKEAHKNPEASLLFPILLFLGSGAIDTILKYLQVNYVPKEDVATFSGSLFGFAALFGAIVILLKSIKKKEPFGVNNLIAGIALGVPNYFSIVFLIKALQVKTFESSALFTMNNVGIVVVSTLVGVLLFKEKMSTKNIIGVILAILGIVIVALN